MIQWLVQMWGRLFLAPVSMLWLLLLVPVLIAFYFLKLKRAPVAVPSLLLWSKVLADQRVNSPFQRFKRHLLLWLQLAMLLLLIFAALQPFWRQGVEQFQALPVVVDISASMAAVDEQTGRSRLDEVKRQLHELVANLSPDQKVCLVAFDRTAWRVTDFTDNPRVLSQAIDRLQVRSVASDLSRPMRLVEALQGGIGFEKVRLYTDGVFNHDIDFQLPFELGYHKVGESVSNMGITAVAGRRRADRGWDLLVTVSGTAESAGLAQLKLLSAGKPVSEPIDLTLTPGGVERCWFYVDTDQPMVLTIGLEPMGFDGLASDNTAYLVLPATRALEVYIAAGLADVRRAMQGLAKVAVHDQPVTSGPCDLVITRRREDLSQAEAPLRLFVGLIPDDLQSVLEPVAAAGTLIDWQREDEALSALALENLSMVRQVGYRSGQDESDLEDAGYQVLAWTQRGPWLVGKQRGRGRDLFMLVSPDQTTLPYRAAFPMLIQNLYREAMGLAGLGQVRGVPTGVLPPMAGPAEMQCRVIDPSGQVQTVQSDGQGLVSGIAASEVGLYRLQWSDGRQTAVGVSLLDERETRLAGAETLAFEELKVSRRPPQPPSRLPLWRWLVILAGVVMLIEWWFYHRPMIRESEFDR